MTTRASARQPQHIERIATLEQKDRAVNERLDDMIKRLDAQDVVLANIQDLLQQGKGALWLATKILGRSSLLCLVIGAGVAVARFITGH